MAGLDASLKASNYAGLLPRAVPLFRLPPLDLSSRALVLGMGGGCDVFAAASIARVWATQPMVQKKRANGSSGATVLFGNCVSPRTFPDDHTALTPALYRVPPDVRALEPGDEAYGSTRLEQSVPRGADGSPLLFIVPKSGKDVGDIEALTAANCAAIDRALDYLRITHVLAVDLGGDSLTGGIDFARDAELGRDRQVRTALQRSLHAGRLSGGATHLVLGPGCDGESSVAAMRESIRCADEAGKLLGVMPRLGGALPGMRELSKGLSASRTPNILHSAFLRGADDAWDESAVCTITRHGHTESVPWAWLTVALALNL